MLTCLPLTLLGQELECCKSVEQVGTYINGTWKMKNSDKNDQLRFEFSDELGKFWRHKFNDYGELDEIEEINQTLEIFETKSGFEIDWSEGHRIVTSKIKILNTTSLILVRRDGKESEYDKIVE